MGKRFLHRFNPTTSPWVMLFLLLGIAFTCEAAKSSRLKDANDWKKAQSFWAFQKPSQQALPKVNDTAWPQQRIDHYVLSKLEKNGLAPSAAAPKNQLIRRLTLDLTGLPPSPEEVTAFVNDASPDAYDRLVTRLLESPRFGERFASMWMNVARYAEDQAHQVGNNIKMFYPNAHHYRTWVINAFNRDLPYDQFIKLQLAADLSDQTSDLPALGFLGLGPKYYNRNRLDVMADEWEDRVDTVTRSFLGLTVACARCHDHKYDPITTKDYYALAGVFASTQLVNVNPNPPEKSKEKKEDKKEGVDPNLLHVVKESKTKDLNVFVRGDVNSKGDVVPRRFLRILCEDQPEKFTEGSGRNELVDAITSPDNPLTARVMVNRLWAVLFGRGIVSTPSNFGTLGGRPTHPALLDDMATRFREGGWSMKSIVREIVLSSTYRQSSTTTEESAAKDQDNQFWWKMDRRRMTVEQWRDSVLFLAGTLDTSGGKSIDLKDHNSKRRTVYGRVSRLELNNMLMLFDYPDANVHSAERPTTTTATQKLFILNSPFVLGQSKQLAERINALDSIKSNEDRAQKLISIVYSRPAEEEEIKLAAQFLSKPPIKNMSRLEQFAQILLASNEMMYVD